jgi:hypothetical protein
MTASYVYALIPCSEQVTFAVSGLDGGEVFCIPNHTVAAVVSASPLADYQGMKRNEAARFLVAHQRVVETVMRDFPVLPVKFGTVLPDETWVGRLLAQGEGLFRSAFEKITSRVQMEVVVLWDLQEVFQQIGQEPPIAQLKEQIAGRAAEDTTTKRLAVGQMVYCSLERRRAALRDQLLSPLRALALDLVVNPPMDDSMVANAALLLDETGQAALDGQLEQLDQEFDGKLLLRCVGPLPPYSFATVDVQVPSFEAIDQARRQLELAKTAEATEIRRAYRRIAGRLHPDHNRQDAEAERHMTELSEAYRLLLTYAECARSHPPEVAAGDSLAEERASATRISFDRQPVEETLLISIWRQEMPV